MQTTLPTQAPRGMLTPKVRKLAYDLGIDARLRSGTGPRGRLRPQDLAPEAEPASPPGWSSGPTGDTTETVQLVASTLSAEIDVTNLDPNEMLVYIVTAAISALHRLSDTDVIEVWSAVDDSTARHLIAQGQVLNKDGVRRALREASRDGQADISLQVVAGQLPQQFVPRLEAGQRAALAVGAVIRKVVVHVDSSGYEALAVRSTAACTLVTGGAVSTHEAMVAIVAFAKSIDAARRHAR